MKQTRLHHEFEFDLETLLRARESRYHHPEIWPEIISSEVTVDKDSGNGYYRERLVYLRNTLPAAVRKTIGMPQIEVLEKQHYRADEHELELTAGVLNLPKFIRVDEHSVYSAIDKNRSQRSITIGIEASLPVISGMIESALIMEYSRKSDEDSQHIIDYVQAERA